MPDALTVAQIEADLITRLGNAVEMWLRNNGLTIADVREEASCADYELYADLLRRIADAM